MTFEISRRLLLPLLAVGGGLMSATLLAFAGHVQDGATQTWTGVSGESGKESHTATTTADYFGLRSLKVYDFDGRACVIDVTQGALNSGKASGGDHLKACEPQQSESWKAVDVGENRFITGIEVCTTTLEGGQTRLRGVRLHGASIGDGAKLKPAKAPAQIEFPNCKSWQPKKVCPKGAIATGLRAHFGERKNGYTGLELRCHVVKVQSD